MMKILSLKFKLKEKLEAALKIIWFQIPHFMNKKQKKKTIKIKLKIILANKHMKN